LDPGVYRGNIILHTVKTVHPFFQEKLVKRYGCRNLISFMLSERKKPEKSVLAVHQIPDTAIRRIGKGDLISRNTFLSIASCLYRKHIGGRLPSEQFLRFRLIHIRTVKAVHKRSRKEVPGKIIYPEPIGSHSKQKQNCDHAYQNLSACTHFCIIFCHKTSLAGLLL